MKDPITGKRPRIKKRLSKDKLQSLRQKFMGKRVRIKNYKFVYGDVSDVVGVVTFLGYNRFFPSWNLQVTVNRLPLQNISLDQIELEEDF